MTKNEEVIKIISLFMKPEEQTAPFSEVSRHVGSLNKVDLFA